MHWQRESEEHGRTARPHGHPTIPMATYGRPMVVKQRNGWGLRDAGQGGLRPAASAPLLPDPLHGHVPDESTVRKLTRRLGVETVAELSRAVVAKAVRERRFRPRGGPDRLDRGRGRRPLSLRRRALLVGRASAGPAGQASGEADRRRGDRGHRPLAGDRAPGAPSRALARAANGEGRRGGDRAERRGRQAPAALGLSGEALASQARARARGRGARAKLQAATALEELARRSEPDRPSKPESACAARGSPTGSSPSPILTPGRSARARRASRTSSATSPRSARWPPTRGRARGASSCRPRRRPATLARTRCCRTPSPSSRRSI